MLTRFAPSPTGYLHIGNMRTALLCYLYARKSGGQMMLRIDDTDLERSKVEYVEALKRDLTWLGIEWDKEEKQSDRFDRYDLAVEKLKADGRLYPCYETEEELDIKRKILKGRGLPPIYDRAALKLTDAERSALEAEGKKPHWRFKMDENPSQWQDEIRGAIKFESGHSSDPILIRENGAYTYMLPSTVDDIELGVTHVLRGEDHVSNTAVQIQMFRALGGEIPTFAHNALIKSKEGKLSKRLGAAGMEEFRKNGIEAMAVASFLAKVGSSDAIKLRHSMQELVDEFDIRKFGKSPTFYALEDIERLNTKLVHDQSFEEVQSELEALDIHIDEAFWDAVKGNIESLPDVKEWHAICNQPLTPVVGDDQSFLLSALELLPTGEWSEETWKQWTGAVKQATDRKGKTLFMPLRKALTGLEHGPELKVILPLIGRERVEKRLKGEVA